MAANLEDTDSGEAARHGRGAAPRRRRRRTSTLTKLRMPSRMRPSPSLPTFQLALVASWPPLKAVLRGGLRQA
jgi:hypothetical protein